MLSLQGMIAKDLEAQGVLPQKFKDLILGPKYPLIKLIDSSGNDTFTNILPDSTYKFVYEDGSDLDWTSASWEFYMHMYATHIHNNYDPGMIAFFDATIRQNAGYINSYNSYGTATHVLTFLSPNNFQPQHVLIRISSSAKKSSAKVQFKVAYNLNTIINTGWDSSKSCFASGPFNFRIYTTYYNNCEVYLDDIRFTYNDRVILGE